MDSPASTTDALTAARRVLRIEAEALNALAEGLDESFQRAVDRLLAAKGRVIVSGMGKSGHVGRKIAATFASTGTPAQFVHPAEASHGDMGMVTRDDVVLMLSNSGETPELANLIAYVKRARIPLIAVASKPDQHADESRRHVALVLPACTGSLSNGAGTDDLDYGHAGSRRCAGRGVDEEARFSSPENFRHAASRRHARLAPSDG